MIRSLDRAIAELVGPIPALRAAVLSAAPDGLIAWCWSRQGEPEIALEFARLDRAATACLEALGAAPESRSLLLTAKDTWVVASPLEELGVELQTNARLVLTIVFSGELQNGMVVVYGRRVLGHLRAVLRQVMSERNAGLRERLVELLVQADDPLDAIEQVAGDAGVGLRALERIEALDDAQHQRVAAATGRRLGDASA